MSAIESFDNEIMFYKTELNILESIMGSIDEKLKYFYVIDSDFHSIYCIKSYLKDKIRICKDNICSAEKMFKMNHIQESLMNENS